MNHFVGRVAGELWTRLGEASSVSLSGVPQLVNQNPSVAYMALGWLARENKVSFHPTENGKKPGIVVSLTSEEAHVFESTQKPAEV